MSSALRPGAELKSDVAWQAWHPSSTETEKARGVLRVRKRNSFISLTLHCITYSKFDVLQGSIYQQSNVSSFIVFIRHLPPIVPSLLLLLSFHPTLICSTSRPFFFLPVPSGLQLCGTQALCRVFWANDCRSSPPSSSSPFFLCLCLSVLCCICLLSRFTYSACSVGSRFCGVFLRSLLFNMSGYAHI